MTLRGAIVGAVVLAILAGVVPAGIALHARLAAALEARARANLALAPRILADRTATTSDALMMYAKEFAHEPRLAGALMAGDRAALDHIANAQSGVVPAGIPIVIGSSGESLLGPLPNASTVAATREGRMPVETHADSTTVHTVALAPITAPDGRWLGAAGFAVPVTDDVAHSLASLTGSEVIIVSSRSGRAVATTLDSSMTRGVVQQLALRMAAAREPIDFRVASDRIAVVAVSLNDAAYAAFARVMRRELAILPTLRRIALLSAAGALAAALILGALLATQVARPVQQLARAARSLGEGNFDAPLPRGRLDEVATVSATFATMRAALQARLTELQAANRELADRAVRLAALQSDLIQRERLSASARLVTHLAHEIRNPVATVRNLLEVIQRRVAANAEVREYTELAIDELLRMHELAERMLDLNRPRDPAQSVTDVAQVAEDVARLMSAANEGDGPVVYSDKETASVNALISPDALKQVLLNLVQNATEAVRQARRHTGPQIDILVRRQGSTVSVTVSDNGPGIPPAILPRIFDPFFTTKESVQGVGLGLFVAEGMVRAAGGRLTASNRSNGGAEFRIELAAVEPAGALVSESAERTL
ncbi:MAG TPA: ATP-binding protein [Gemmatimonadaceae bacterium]|nr:ATP-binding protein [Gemmatimonadaceae bacterium]